MRWIDAPKPRPYIGQTRIVKRFLILPRCLPNSKNQWEWRWLEYCKIRQKYAWISEFDCSWDNERWWNDA